MPMLEWQISKSLTFIIFSSIFILPYMFAIDNPSVYSIFISAIDAFVRTRDTDYQISSHWFYRYKYFVFDTTTWYMHEGLRPGLEGFVVTRQKLHEGAGETGSSVPRLLGRRVSECTDRTSQTGLS